MAAFLLSILSASLIAQCRGIPNGYRVSTGRLFGNGKVPAHVNGRLEFDQTLDIELQDDTNTRRRVHLVKVDVNVGHSNNRKDKMSAVYRSSNMILRQECSLQSGNVVCHETAISHGRDRTLYIKSSGGPALVMPKPDEDLPFNDDMPGGLPFPTANGRRRRHSRSSLQQLRRSKRAFLSNDVIASRVVKLIMFPDAAFMNIFSSLNNNDLSATKTDVTNYLTLVCNEMTLHYQTLKDYGLEMTVDGETVPQDIAVALVAVEFPPDNGNFAWSENNVDDGSVYDVFTQNGDLSYTASGIQEDFRQFLIHNFTTTVAYDYATAITGYNLKTIFKYNDGTSSLINRLGLAYYQTLCKASAKKEGKHSAITELGPTLGRIAAHELGHGMGATHDDSVTCANRAYIMSDVIFAPCGSTADTYHRFSSCSARAIATYTASIAPSDFVDTCLMTPDDAFLKQFCQGFTGSTLSFDDVCVLRFGVGATRKTESNGTKEAHLSKRYVEQCIASDDLSVYPFVCLHPVSGFLMITEAPVGTNCLAPDGSQNPDNVCYQGRCVSQLNLCENTGTTPASTTTTTTTTTSTSTTTTITSAPSTSSTSTTSSTTSTTTTTMAPTTSGTCSCITNACCETLTNANGTCCEGCVSAKVKGRDSCELYSPTSDGRTNQNGKNNGTGR